MKKTIKLTVSLLMIFCLMISMFVITVSAASVTTNGGNYEVGQSVKIPVKYTADAGLFAVEVKATYNSSVLRLESVSGVSASDVQNKNGTINFIDDNFSNDSRTSSYTLNFTAIAAGNSNISISVTGSDGDKEFPASASAAITVVTPKPSSNANLASIKLSSGSLSPAFNANTTNYTATVKYSVESITITGAVADGGATYTGGGTFALAVGDNQRALTVTAADGTKKTYTINIKRMTEQETADAEQAARDADPLLVIINSVDYTIVNNFEGITIPAGFTQATATRKESEITVLNDDAGKYQICYLVDANGENGAFYIRDSEDQFTKLVYISTNGKMYIVEELGDYGNMPAGFRLSKCSIDGTEAEAIVYEDEVLKDFYILNCYIDGTVGYYRFDTVDGTLQRAVDFDAALSIETTDVPVEKDNGKFAWFTNMTSIGKIVFLIVVFVAVLLIAVAIILIIKIASSGKDDYEDEYVSDVNDEFVLNDFADEVAENAAPEPYPAEETLQENVNEQKD